MPQVSAAPLPPPKGAPRIPAKRLASLKRPPPTPIRRSQPPAQPTKPAQPKPPKPTTHPKTTTCPNQSCPEPEIVEDDGKKVCVGCGTVVSESNIVSEVTFGESSSGAAIVQGTFVGADQSHGRSFGPGFQRGGGMESREITEQNGNRYINQLSRALNVPESATKAAGQVFKLAVGLNFIQGRRTKTVAAVSLYIACRRQENNTVMLIDFADVLMLNVFKLGRAYKALLEELRLGGNVFLMNPVDPESLIYRFAKQLEFGSSMMQVAGEAVRIVQRMNRDWMITGRRPAGICGAALILAARMNNFRRTVREVVYVVKVTEVTIMQRLNEFRDTESGDLTVDQFRSVQLENSHDPPAFTQAREGKKSRGSKKRKAAETAEDVEGDDSDESSTPAESTEPPAKRAKRVDADGFAIPDIPIDPALQDQNGDTNSKASTPDPSTGEDASKPKRGRPKASKSKPPPPTASDLALENALEDEMTELLSSSSNMVTSAKQPPKKPVSSSTEVDSTEFESDPEVANCLLTPEEVEIKERIWVHENKDYLRTQQAKALKRALTEDPSQDGAAQLSKPRKKRKGRMGDVRYLEGEDGENGSRRASTPAEATRLMLEKRGFSKKINYRKLEDLYGEEIVKDGKKSKSSSQDPHATARRLRSESLAASGAGGSPGRSVSRSVEPGVATRQLSATQQAATSPTPEPPAPTPPQTTTPTTAQRPKAPEPPANPNEEVLGYLPGYEGEEDEEAALEIGPPPALPDDEEDDEDDDDDDEDEDGIEAAFSGNYYNEDSDGGGYDEDDYYD